ncbi:HEAT repeat domain-containing protein [Kitasatospora aureofaciens]|uniref:HEAT repeat domain-containing protein n=1 Tax=Kitasatospora aureofaciens TaxID=1894 RepID=UPI001C4479F0|nr:HEAT repeat domain-containing protein [Kitasatospora aureofaciens]MBV6699377.1 HEAT repeat domain-containing protein [Kitasatospora aureofaciens]
MSAPDDLLDGLDDIDWPALGHAYGSAGDVPDDLRAVCGPDGTARGKAFERLSGTIFHQGTRYSASPYAVPFLVRIAAAGPPSARVGALWLLTRLAVDWHDTYDLPLGIDTAAWRAAVVTPEENLRWYDEQIAAETDEKRLHALRRGRDHVAAGHPADAREGALRSYDAVRAELPRLRVLLDDPDAAIRTRIAYLLGWFPEAAAESLPPLLERLEDEQDPVVAATALVAVGLLADSGLADRLRPYLDAGHPLTRWAAATALARLAALRTGEAPDARVTARVVAELAAFASRPAPEPGTDHSDGDLHGYTARTLLALLAPARDEDEDGILTAVAHCLRFMSIRAVNDLAPQALRAAVAPAGPAVFSELPPGQRDFLRTLADRLPADWYDNWLSGSAVRKALSSLGLPDTGPALRAYTGLPPEEPEHPDADFRPGRP